MAQHGDYEALRLLALKARVKPDLTDLHRFVARWYSKEFHTPLHVVFTLPIDDLWRAYFEEQFAEMEQIDIEQEVAIALETPEQREKRLSEEGQENQAEDAFAALAEAANAASKAKTAADALVESVNKTKDLPPDINVDFVSPDEMERIISGKSIR
jgi:hypothetical protein